MLMLVYAWLRFDPVIRLAFGSNWKPRYDFMSQIFGEAAAREFLARRVKLALLRRPKPVSLIFPSEAERQTRAFLSLSVSTKSGRKRRLAIINRLIFWATNRLINRENIDSYKTRAAIVDSLLNPIFHNSLFEESELILASLDRVVFSRVTYLGQKGEPSPFVHDVILGGVSRLLLRHFAEVVRFRDQRLDKISTIQLIRELNKSRAGTGSLAFSADPVRRHDELRHKFPLRSRHVYLLYKILEHYTFSAWPDSRQKAREVIGQLEQQLKTNLKSLIIKTKNE